MIIVRRRKSKKKRREEEEGGGGGRFKGRERGVEPWRASERERERT